MFDKIGVATFFKRSMDTSPSLFVALVEEARPRKEGCVRYVGIFLGVCVVFGPDGIPPIRTFVQKLGCQQLYSRQGEWGCPRSNPDGDKMVVIGLLPYATPQPNVFHVNETILTVTTKRRSAMVSYHNKSTQVQK